MSDTQLAAWLHREASNHDAHGQFVMRKAAQAISRLQATANLLARHDKALPLSTDHGGPTENCPVVCQGYDKKCEQCPDHDGQATDGS